MKKSLLLLAAFLLVLAGPILLRPKNDFFSKADKTLVIVTPNNEAIRYEFTRAFGEYYFKKTGKSVRIDWRTPGGTSEISRYLASEYLAAFQNYWTKQLGRPWNAAVRGAFDNPAIQLAASPEKDSSPEQAVRRAFLVSNVGCGIDLFFGGGSFDLALQAAAGRLVDCGIVRAHPELFNARCIPQTVGGEPYWDPKGRWLGVCLGAFGICYNVDSLARLGINRPPAQWNDLAAPAYFGEVALSDPTQSGSVAKAFEMLIQQQMLLRSRKSAPDADAVREGWMQALRLIQEIAGNARYFTDSATRTPWDVESGDAAAGMCIDFYGRFQSEAVRKPGGFSRMKYITPVGGSSVGVDPIGMFRGAPDPALAREFIEFVLSADGQKLWNWKVGTPGGPVKYALRRLPIRPDLYAPEFAPFRSDPDVDPYRTADAFVYHPKWTSPLFQAISFIIRCMCVEPHDELSAAWRALIAAGFPPEASAAFYDVSNVDYAAASGPIREALRSPRKIAQVRLASSLEDSFRARYLRAAELARLGK